MKKILLIGISENLRITTRIMEEAARSNHSVCFIKWRSLVFRKDGLYSDDKEIYPGDYSLVFLDIPIYDVVTDKEKGVRLPFDLCNECCLLLKIFRKNKVPVINGEFILKNQYYNKFTQALIFSEHKIPSIPTVHFADNNPQKMPALLRKANFNFPLVVKESFGGMGKDVWKMKNKKELTAFFEQKRNTNYVIQPYVKNDGDYRVLIIGGKSLGIMKRKARKGEWKNNFALGGKIEAYKDKKMERFAEKACKKIGLDYAGVDILKGDGKYLVIEINVFARFEGFEKTFPGVNVPRAIINCFN